MRTSILVFWLVGFSLCPIPLFGTATYRLESWRRNLHRYLFFYWFAMWNDRFYRRVRCKLTLPHGQWRSCCTVDQRRRPDLA